MTLPLYIDYPDLFSTSAHIVSMGNDARGAYCVLDHSLFYPQGGGQPADQGKIISADGTYTVFDVRNAEGEIRHYIVDNHPPMRPGLTVTMTIDQDKRMLHYKYHTAGHLIAAVAETINPELKAIKGHQFPGEAYVEFEGMIDDANERMAKTTLHMKQCIKSNGDVKTQDLGPGDRATMAQDFPYALPKDKSLRMCHIAGFSPVPCGGTHVKTLEEIAAVTIKKCQSKKGKTKIYYAI
jgi:alanyl-tRNA synthetase